MVLLIDNYDSFSYNLYQLIGELEPNAKLERENKASSYIPVKYNEETEPDIKVIRNDEYSVEEIEKMNPSHIIISPGPGRPADAGVCEEVVKKLGSKIPILGVCLGHQAICEAFGATVSYAKKLMHGKMSVAKIDNTSRLYSGLGDTAEVARYHSLSAVRETLPSFLKVTAFTDDGEVMSVEHTEYPIYGVQFHPESILTPQGRIMLKNFLDITK